VLPVSDGVACESTALFRATQVSALAQVRLWLILFIVGLAISGITAFPLETELRVASSVVNASPLPDLLPQFVVWVDRVRDALIHTNDRYPFIAYGTDWLAFAHLVIALVFVGPLRDPVRNVWVVQFGMIACVAVIPLALIAGSIRGIPLGWQLIDMSFGVIGIVPLVIVYRLIRQLEREVATTMSLRWRHSAAAALIGHDRVHGRTLRSGARTLMDSYFERLDATRFMPTSHAGGAWNDTEIHFSPLAGLIVHAIDVHRASGDDQGKQLGRISFDILGFLAADECEVRVETIRPGRTIELIEATVTIRGRTAVRARAWFIGTGDTSAVAGGEPARLAGPEGIEGRPLTQTWSGGYVASLEVRPLEAPKPGRTTAWLRTHTELVAGEPASAHASFIALVDTANGIAVRQSPKEWLFPNLDLTIHLYRQPTGHWVGLDTAVTFGPAGLGVTSTALHDVDGPIGRAEQILTVRAQQA
jgi:hypothetical protein